MKIFRSHPAKLRVALVGLSVLFSLPVQAQVGTTTKRIASHRKGVYDATVVYPAFRSKTPLARLANRTIAQWANTQYADFRKQALKDHPKGEYDREYAHHLRPVFARAISPRLLSAGVELYQDFAGAHGLATRHTFNFGLVNGQPRRLALGDFFRPGSNYQKRVSDAVITRLKKEPNADWVQDGSVTSLTVQQLNSFGVETDGLRYYFDPYEMGSYAAGPFQVKLTLSELGPDFRRDWLR